MVNNPLATQETQETQVRYLSQEDPLEKGMATHSNILAWKIPQRSLAGYSVHGVAKSQPRLSTHTFCLYKVKSLQHPEK